MRLKEICRSIFLYFILFYFFWPHRVACRISVPQPGIEPRPRQWKPRILTTRPPGNSQECFSFTLLFLKYLLSSKHQFKFALSRASSTISPHFLILKVLGTEQSNIKLLKSFYVFWLFLLTLSASRSWTTSYIPSAIPHPQVYHHWPVLN